MAITLFTNSSAMSASNALQKANSTLSSAMEHLGTGKRINKASDDAAGLQVATRLQGQTNGMAVAQRNIADASTMLQTGEGAMDEVSNIMYRMKDLATQAASDTNTTSSRNAISDELSSLNDELGSIMNNTSYAGDSLFGGLASNKTTSTDGKNTSDAVTASNGKMSGSMTFQIGASKGETSTVSVADKLNQLKNMISSFGKSGNVDTSTATTDATDAEKKKYSTPEITGKPSDTDGQVTKSIVDGKVVTVTDKTTKNGLDVSTSANANSLIDTLNSALDNVSSLRSSFGASINSLGHASANLTNMKDNTDQALGNIQDADFASEASKMTRSQMLAQTSTSMLKQSNSMSSLVMSILG
ncbi:lateral flagellin LafA [Rosenbergiella epipactidis]|uniref:flagellin N-terminal helical domain-containing protein n=1 Tax=Rosenbergiella epipactidis TaxID=1544694 RepID=UPI002026A981|nr:flagellin [Rosenbergiella epipactidis]MCL9668905.1 lateral flagellin LafA [Rosenbergiella epipactidis]